jgi:hypothetical protein
MATERLRACSQVRTVLGPRLIDHQPIENYDLVHDMWHPSHPKKFRATAFVEPPGLVAVRAHGRPRLTREKENLRSGLRPKGGRARRRREATTSRQAPI